MSCNCETCKNQPYELSALEKAHERIKELEHQSNIDRAARLLTPSPYDSIKKQLNEYTSIGYAVIERDASKRIGMFGTLHTTKDDANENLNEILSVPLTLEEIGFDQVPQVIECFVRLP